MNERRPTYDFDWTLPPRATDDAGKPGALSPSQEIALIAMGAIDLYLAYANTRGHTPEGSRLKALEKVAESLVTPSPTLAAMLAADKLLAACRLALDDLETWHSEHFSHQASDGGRIYDACDGCSTCQETLPALVAAIKKAEASS